MRSIGPTCLQQTTWARAVSRAHDADPGSLAEDIRLPIVEERLATLFSVDEGGAVLRRPRSCSPPIRCATGCGNIASPRSRPPAQADAVDAYGRLLDTPVRSAGHRPVAGVPGARVADADAGGDGRRSAGDRREPARRDDETDRSRSSSISSLCSTGPPCSRHRPGISGEQWFPSIRCR